MWCNRINVHVLCLAYTCISPNHVTPAKLTATLESPFIWLKVFTFKFNKRFGQTSRRHNHYTMMGWMDRGVEIREYELSWGRCGWCLWEQHDLNIAPYWFRNRNKFNENEFQRCLSWRVSERMSLFIQLCCFVQVCIPRVVETLSDSHHIVHIKIMFCAIKIVMVGISRHLVLISFVFL